MNWQPIETAPKNGTRVILWAPDWSAPNAGQFYGEASGGWGVLYEQTFRSQPTHWQPLPDPPA